MGSKSFDDIIKAKLKELERLTGSGDWEAFEQKYEEHQTKEFDQSIKDKLSQQGILPIASDWAFFEEMYDGELTGDFDQAIREKLSELDTMAGPNDWDTFEKLFEDDIVGDEGRFDRQIADKMDSINVPYNSSHWVLLKKRLEREEYIITSIYFAKIAEAAILFLLLFTFLNIFPGLSYHQNPLTPIAENKNHSINASKAYDEMEKTTKEDLYKNNDQNLKTAQNPILLNPTLQNSTIPQSEEKPTIASNLINAKTGTLQPLEKNPIKLVQYPQAKSFTHQELSQYVRPLLAQHTPLQNEKMEIYRAVRHHQVKENQVKGQSFLGFSIAPTVNIVNSPADFATNTDPYSTDALGMEAGMLFSHKKSKIELETGAFYGRKSYNPLKNIETTGNFTSGYVREASLNSISYDVVSLPVMLKVHAIERADWNVYAGVGTNFHLITNAGYVIEKSGAIIEDIESFQRGAQTRSTTLAKKDFTQGIFNDGNIHDNLFMTLDFTVGVQGAITDKLWFFLAPTLRQHIGLAGIGPNKDKVHSLGVNLGIKKRI